MISPSLVLCEIKPRRRRSRRWRHGTPPQGPHGDRNFFKSYFHHLPARQPTNEKKRKKKKADNLDEPGSWAYENLLTDK